jgi:putative ABC transport system substrate-binding protein
MCAKLSYPKLFLLRGTMRRRDFVKVIGGAITTWPVLAQAQQRAALRRVGVLLVGFSPDSKAASSFRQGLQDAGYTEGRDVVIEWRSAGGDYRGTRTD